MLSRRNFLGGLGATLATLFVPKKSLGDKTASARLESVIYDQTQDKTE